MHQHFFFLKDGLELASVSVSEDFSRKIFKKIIPRWIFFEFVFEISNSVFHVSSGSRYHTYSSYHKNEEKFYRILE